MASIISLFRRAALAVRPGLRNLAPTAHAATSFVQITDESQMDEETLPDYVASEFYPVRIGQTFTSAASSRHYQIMSKLGFGRTSTVWLAKTYRSDPSYVALKVHIGTAIFSKWTKAEIPIYKSLDRPSLHPDRDAVRPLLDSFQIQGEHGQNHYCFVHPVLYDTVRDFLERNPIGRLPVEVLKIVLVRVLSALDYLHTECHIVHTDIRAENIMFGVTSDYVFKTLEEYLQRNPVQRKVLDDGREISVRYHLPLSDGPLAEPVLCDLGAARKGPRLRESEAQPPCFRAPGVILQISWDHMVDIWNLGAMIWDIYEGKLLFRCTEPDESEYSERMHLAEIIAFLGPPEADFVRRGKAYSEFFSEDGTFLGNTLPKTSLEDVKSNLEGEEKALFLQFVRKMLQWDPKKRSSAKDLLQDEWLNSCTTSIES